MRHAPFLHYWNAVINNGDKFSVEKLMRAADEKLIINELGPYERARDKVIGFSLHESTTCTPMPGFHTGFFVRGGT